MRRIIALFLIVIMVILLSACGEQTATVNAERSGESHQAVPEAENAKQMEEDPLPYDMESVEDAFALAGNESYEDIEEIAAKDVEDTLCVLDEELASLIAEIDSYEAYLENADKVEAFYGKVIDESQKLCIRMCEYSLDFAEMIVASGESADHMYDNCETIYDCIYDDAGDEIYDGIYDGLLDDIYDVFYNGVLDDKSDGVEYSEWADARSNEYEWWSNARSDCYEHWSDMRSDVYEFWSDIRSELWNDNVDKAKEEIEDFREDVQKMSDKAGLSDAEASMQAVSDNGHSVAEETISETTDGLRPEFKEAMDAYEAFYGEYCSFMESYQNDPTNFELLMEYADMLLEAEEMNKTFEAWDEEDLSDEELAYYLEVNGRIMQMLLETAE